MDIQKNARLTISRREAMAFCVIGGGLSKARPAHVYGVPAEIVARWMQRYKAEGRA
jgi:hypothetical protein